MRPMPASVPSRAPSSVNRSDTAWPSPLATCQQYRDVSSMIPTLASTAARRSSRSLMGLGGFWRLHVLLAEAGGDLVAEQALQLVGAVLADVLAESEPPVLLRQVD